jgi:hypothetical protein
LALGAKVGAVALFVASLWVLRIVDEPERAELRSLMRRARSLGRVQT